MPATIGKPPAMSAAVAGEAPLRPAARPIGRPAVVQNNLLRRHKLGQRPLQVFTDVDDTLICAGASIHGQMYANEIYPGALQFELELSRGPSESIDPPSLILLTARPRELANIGLFKVTAEDRLAVEAARVGRENGLSSWGVNVRKAQYGQLVDQVLPSDWRIGRDRTKYTTWLAVSAGLDTPSVFIGDNGKGDLSAAEQMMRAPRPIVAAFIHNVRDAPRRPSASRRVVAFDTYIEAAVKANAMGLISSGAVERVRKSVANSGLMQLCMRMSEFRFGMYPCVSVSTGSVFDKMSARPINDIALTPDLSAILPACGASGSAKKIDLNGRCRKLERHSQIYA